MDFAILFLQMYFMESSQYFQSLEFADDIYERSKWSFVVVLLLEFALTGDYNPECGFGHKDVMRFKWKRRWNQKAMRTFRRALVVSSLTAPLKSTCHTSVELSSL